MPQQGASSKAGVGQTHDTLPTIIKNPLEKPLKYRLGHLFGCLFSKQRYPPAPKIRKTASKRKNTSKHQPYHSNKTPFEQTHSNTKTTNHVVFHPTSSMKNSADPASRSSEFFHRRRRRHAGAALRETPGGLLLGTSTSGGDARWELEDGGVCLR